MFIAEVCYEEPLGGEGFVSVRFSIRGVVCCTTFDQALEPGLVLRAAPFLLFWWYDFAFGLLRDRELGGCRGS